MSQKCQGVIKLLHSCGMYTLATEQVSRCVSSQLELHNLFLVICSILESKSSQHARCLSSLVFPEAFNLCHTLALSPQLSCRQESARVSRQSFLVKNAKCSKLWTSLCEEDCLYLVVAWERQGRHRTWGHRHRALTFNMVDRDVVLTNTIFMISLYFFLLVLITLLTLQY